MVERRLGAVAGAGEVGAEQLAARFRKRPPTMTVSTLRVSAWWTTVETGSITG
jgi:hypothetical protein